MSARHLPPSLPQRAQFGYLLLIPCVLLGLGVLSFISLRIAGLVRIFEVSSNAMAPTISSGDLVFTEGISVGLKGVKHGEVIVFSTDKVPKIPKFAGSSGFWIMRIAALPGDRFQIKDGRAWINGSPAPELSDLKYAPIHPTSAWAGIDVGVESFVPPGHCIILGDNTGNSLDSRYWSFLPLSAIEYAYCFHLAKNPDRFPTPPH